MPFLVFFLGGGLKTRLRVAYDGRRAPLNGHSTPQARVGSPPRLGSPGGDPETATRAPRPPHARVRVRESAIRFQLCQPLVLERLRVVCRAHNSTPAVLCRSSSF